MKLNGIAFGAVAWIALCAQAQSAGTQIHTEDVDLFYKIYDAAGGHPTAEQLQRDYLDAGSEGLHNLAKLRRVTGVRIAETLAAHPEIYSKARGCMAVLPRVRDRSDVALRTLVRLYPQARTPPVTIAVGRGKPDEHPTVLERSLIEGAAEFVAELISGRTGYSHFPALTKGREKEIETAFAADVDLTDLSRWIDNSTMEQGNELGTRVGYRITRAYYRRAADKQLALREILELSDPKAFLAKSGWRPGMQGTAQR